MFLSIGFFLGGRGLLLREYRIRVQNLIDKELLVFANEYRAAENHFREMANFLQEEVLAEINGIRAADLLYQAKMARSDEEKAELRQAIYEDLSPLYRHLERRGFRQLHFHTPESVSFLRMHSPENFGDSLRDVRPTVVKANQELRKISGFEEGRIFNGYRFVFPLFANGVHVGSMECSFGSTAIWRYLEEMHPGHSFMLLHSREVIESTVFETYQHQYVPTRFSAEFFLERHPWIERHPLRLMEQGPEEADLIEVIRHFLDREEVLLKPGVHPIAQDSASRLLLTYPVRNIFDRPVGVLMALEPEPVLDELRENHRRNRLGLNALSLVLSFSWLAALVAYHWSQYAKREESERIRSISGTLPGMLFQLRTGQDSRLECIYASPASMELFGFQPRELRADPELLLGMLDETGRDKLRTGLSRLPGTQRNLLLRFATGPTHHPRWFELRLRPDPSVTAQWSGYVTDVSEQVNNEQYMRNLNEELEATNLELQTTLEDARAATRRAEEANRSKSDFISQISRQIQNPVQACLGLSEVLRASVTEEELRTCVEGIQDSLNRLRQQIQDVQDFSQLEGGWVRMRSQPFQPAEVLQACLTDLSSECSAREVKFSCFLQGGIPYRLKGDAERLRQLLHPFIRYCVRRSFQSNVELSVGVEENDASSILLSLRLLDHGSTIPPQDILELNRDVKGLTAETPSRFGGDGLSIHIGRKLLSMMGGRLRVLRSREDTTELLLQVRFEKCGAPEDSAPAPEEFQGTPCLFLESEPSLREQIQREGAKWGLMLKSSNAPGEALALSRLQMKQGHPFRVAIVVQTREEDRCMDFIRDLRADPGLRDMQVLLVCSLTASRKIPKEEAGLLDALLLKPLNFSELQDTLRWALSPSTDPKHHGLVKKISV